MGKCTQEGPDTTTQGLTVRALTQPLKALTTTHMFCLSLLISGGGTAGTGQFQHASPCNCGQLPASDGGAAAAKPVANREAGRQQLGVLQEISQAHSFQASGHTNLWLRL